MDYYQAKRRNIFKKAFKLGNPRKSRWSKSGGNLLKKTKKSSILSRRRSNRPKLCIPVPDLLGTETPHHCLGNRPVPLYFCPRSTWYGNASSLQRSDIEHSRWTGRLDQSSLNRPKSSILSAIQHCVAWSNTAVRRTVQHSNKPFSTAQNPTALRFAIHHFSESYSSDSVD